VTLRIIFGIVSSLGLIAALGTVLSRNLVHAALYLVAFFFVIACQFVLLEAEFLAAMQVLVYIGAVAILLMFGIMLTRNILGDETTGGTWSRKIPAALLATGFVLLLVMGIRGDRGGSNRTAWRDLDVRPAVADGSDARGAAINNMGDAIGREMMTRWLIPFELAGLLLTAALVGAIALAQSDTTGEETPGGLLSGAFAPRRRRSPSEAPTLVAEESGTARS
jgi:NADH-quinone oxidoreductase subunit J